VIARLAIALAVVLAACPAGAEVTLQEFSWSKLQAQKRLVSGQVTPADSTTPFESLVVENTESTPVAFTVLVIEKPGITASTYAILGSVAYEGVESKSYLEMWNYFPDGSRYFSRTLGDSGPMQSLEGTSDWRPFELPFFLGAERKRPDRLVVSVVLPGKGRVRLGPLRLVEYRGQGARGWWSDTDGAYIGVIAGLALVCLSGMVWRLSSRGAARGFVFTLMGTMVLLGAALVGGGIAALALSQPAGVVVPLLLPGGLMVAIPAGSLRAVRSRYEEIELRRMAARDA
jgi:hypothetical protein